MSTDEPPVVATDLTEVVAGDLTEKGQPGSVDLGGGNSALSTTGSGVDRREPIPALAQQRVTEKLPDETDELREEPSPSLRSTRDMRLEELFYAGLDGDAQERARLVRQVCEAEPEMGRELEALFAADKEPCSWKPWSLKLATSAPWFADSAPAPLDGRLPLTVKHYWLLRKLGCGGMSEVFLAEDLKLERLVAVKFLLTRTDELRNRLLSEARITARCRHENIVVIHDIDEFEGQPYLVLEYLDGLSLRESVAVRNRSDGRRSDIATTSSIPSDVSIYAVEPQKAVQMMIPIVRALAHAHDLGIVHRDLKPENVFVDKSGTIKVLDFGIAKGVVGRDPKLAMDGTVLCASTAGRPETLVTQDGMLIGTPAYMSPEQWNRRGVDHRTDIWAVGIMLFELIAGHHPLVPSSIQELQNRVLNMGEPMPRLDRVVPTAVAISELVARCLVKCKDHRSSDTHALLRELESLTTSTERLPSVQGDLDKVLAHGDRVAGSRYELRRKIGASGTAEVWEATQLSMRRPIALKVLRDFAMSSETRRHFLRQAQIVGQLRHPNIVTVYETGLMEGGLVFTAMELLGNRDLEQLLREGSSIRPCQSLRIMSQVADALAEAHRHDVTHGNVKPRNIHLASERSGVELVKVRDFGYGNTDAFDARPPAWTSSSIVTLVGTPRYMSPEQWQGHTAEKRSDIYAMGAILHELIVGEPVHAGAQSLVEIAVEALSGKEIHPKQSHPDVEMSDSLAELISSCLSPNPDRRPSSAEVLGTKLRYELHLLEGASRS